jgi:hypothetical protein
MPRRKEITRMPGGGAKIRRVASPRQVPSKLCRILETHILVRLLG